MTTTTRALLSLAPLVALGLAACDKPDLDEPEALFTLRGHVEQGLEATVDPSSDGLHAYLVWANFRSAAVVIDEAPITGDFPALFQLAVNEEPSEELFNDDVPGTAFAMVFAMTPEAMAIWERGIHGDTSAVLPDGTVAGFSQTWVVYSRDGAPVEGLALAPGFNLIGPDPVAIACGDDAYAAYDACTEANVGRCDGLLDDGDYDGYEACASAGYAACDGELDRVAECGSTMKVLDEDTDISIELQRYSASDSNDVEDVGEGEGEGEAP
jgi:hypothetical protein